MVIFAGAVGPGLTIILMETIWPKSRGAFTMDDIDRKILDEIQINFPLSPRPLKVLVGRLGLSEKEIGDRIRTLRKSGIIRRIGASLNSRKLGYTSTLCAMKVPEESLEGVAEVQQFSVNNM